MRFKRVTILFFLLTFFACNNDNNIAGNYYACADGEYVEMYFKQDSMRIAADNVWVKLSEWRKIKISNDTLNFTLFGEWSDSSKAIIKKTGINKVQMYFFQSTMDTVNLTPILENPNFENSEEFWKGFDKRRKSSNCKTN